MPFRLLTWFASALLLLIFSAITTRVWIVDEHEMQLRLEQDSSRLQVAFDVAVSNLEQQMLALASLLAADPEIQRLFDQGRVALEAEGGGAGGVQAAQARAALLARVEPQWRYLQVRFGVRQLHFHLGSETSVSFLRVHAQDRFGDRSDPLRRAIADTLRDRQPHAGFETGRVQAGVRGVVPVEVRGADGARRLIGVVEAGTAFDSQLGLLDRQLGAGFAVLLKPSYVESAIWQEYRGGLRRKVPCDCYLEASSRVELRNWLMRLPFAGFGDQVATQVMHEAGTDLHLGRFPLRDYAGRIDPARQPVGSVLIWRDVSEQLQRHRQSQLTLAGFALAGYLFSQVILLWLLNVTRRRWQLQVQKKATALHESETRFQLLLMDLGEGVFGVDLQDRVSFINPAALQMLDMHGEDVLGREQHLLFQHHNAHGRDYLPADCPINLTLADGLARHEEQDWFWRRDGSGFPVALTVTPVLRNGVRVGAVVVFQDISERLAHEQQLEYLATTDPLTGVSNRRLFLQQLDHELARHQRYRDPAALLMLDLDHFKQINDQYGHATGDQVLKACTACARQVLRRSDHLGRLGGEEFAILLPDTDTNGAREMAERLRRAIQDSPVETASGPIRYTISIGIALFAADGNADALLARADRAMYQAKQHGRNRVEMDTAEADTVG